MRCLDASTPSLGSQNGVSAPRNELGKALNYMDDRVHCQVWLRLSVRRLARAPGLRLPGSMSLSLSRAADTDTDVIGGVVK